MYELITKSPAETEAFGKKLGELLGPGSVVALFGEMGVGKTALTRGIAAGLGIPEGVSSPTFALVHQYDGRLPVYHFDMYRVETWDDLYSTGFFDYLDSGGVIIIEWSENIENAIPENAIRIHLKRGKSENERIISCEGVDL
ncbi:MAG: tRNA threonylcarbamoyladenosine biosynthesis protein TsaE [Thermocaproicibacter melissae]|jgi:tRNA threonylcarbamoyladenosine biosynthesis protein TsaE|uniref:tRNA (adenosine(37)-N6)-threonylcarbamoyltransferase complex ATPase subunit type 1 TsaE n=1 Tax=Thermocaproicibacter melissae TaxID=2966552 RepID=UPI0024B1C98C|nr:tRNA (adenosine(37)-N6)-threonylcarbamoyltransferase complex ATPase subunit type 1 TsaE [Thermocaproicibacter melissae]WBY64772.1 tRNA (adenosine(37)-N6)-threonylcarbamoyltransferase complex ATPase subunit type 1 TsaE [Thermocaproicibacter melissae]